MFHAQFFSGNLLNGRGLCFVALLFTGSICRVFSAEPAALPQSAVLSIHHPPPAEPPVLRGSGLIINQQAAAAGAELYSIGDPTPEEQLYLEMINRARANPSAEAQLFYHTADPAVLSSYDNNLWVVDLKAMTNQFELIPPAPPLAMNAQLLAAARKHSQDMFAHVFQGHTSSDGRTLADRVAVESYPYARLSENVFAYAKSVWHGHAGFEVDWGPGNDGTGMQTPPGHRNAIHNPLHTEVGIGVMLGTRADPAGVKPTVGPQLVTQDFGAQVSPRPFVTGVVYYDLNGNNFYDVGEGIGGVIVSASGVAGAAVTARSGGYALPLPGDGTYSVSFSAADLPGHIQQVTVSEGQNVKVDYRPVYQPPVIVGPAAPEIGTANHYTFSAVGGADYYQWRSLRSEPAGTETADHTNRVTVQKNGTYDVLNTEFFVSPPSAFRLTQVDPPQHQILTLQSSFLLGEEASFRFQSRLGIATANQKAQVEMSTDDGLTWELIYSQGGGTEEKTFVERSVSLANNAGKTARFRFRYRFDFGSYYPTSQSAVGWYFDDIQVVNAEEILSSSTAIAEGNGFHLTPPSEGRIGLQVRARAGHDFLEWGPALYVQPQPGPPQVQISRIVPAGTKMRIEFQWVEGDEPDAFVLEANSGMVGPWSAELEVDSGEIVKGKTLSVEVPVYRYQQRFFRIRALTR